MSVCMCECEFSVLLLLLFCIVSYVKQVGISFCPALNDEFAAMTKKKKDLEDNIDLCSQKLDRCIHTFKGLLVHSGSQLVDS